jgi:hypothetical protein
VQLWRVNQVLQFSRRTVQIHHVILPSLLLFLAAIVLLSVWTATSQFTYERIEINAITGESIGACRTEGSGGFFSLAINILIWIPTMLTGKGHCERSVALAYSTYMCGSMILILSSFVLRTNFSVLCRSNGLEDEGCR